MHVGRQYKFTQFLCWTRWEAACLIGWALLVTLLLQVSPWNFLTVPMTVLTIIGSALAIILGVQERAMFRALQRGACAFRAAHHEQFDPCQQADICSLRPGCRAIRPAPERHVLSPFRLADGAAFFLREKKTWENTLRVGKRSLSCRASHAGKPIDLQGRAEDLPVGCRVAEIHGASRRQGSSDSSLAI